MVMSVEWLQSTKEEQVICVVYLLLEDNSMIMKRGKIWRLLSNVVSVLMESEKCVEMRVRSVRKGIDKAICSSSSSLCCCCFSLRTWIRQCKCSIQPEIRIQHLR